MEVELISQQQIKPSRPTPSHLQNIPISFFDQRIPPITVPFIFYYPNHENHPINSIEHIKMLNHLRKSLSDILTLFYPLAGRYIKESHSLKCEDQGVLYSEALVSVPLSDILDGKFQIHELTCLVDERQESDTNPLVSIRINIFKCGGLAIATANSHRIIDGFTSSLFTNGWAKACKTGHVDECPVPNFECGVLFPPRQNSTEVKLPPLSSSKSQVVTERFVFKANQKSMSTSMVIAVIWRALIKASRARHGAPRSSLITIAVNWRGKIRKIPENCCGNILTNAVVRFEVEDDEKEMGLDVLEERVRSTMKVKLSEVCEDEDEDEWLYESVMGPTREVAEEARKGVGDIHRFSSLRGFPWYEVDFGWGKPAWLSFVKRMHKGILILDTKDGDGVEAWVTADKEEMEYMQTDPDIINFYM